MLTSGLFTSTTDLWATPQDLFDRLNAKYHFTLDVCAIPENAKCKRFFTPEIDGLSQEWGGSVAFVTHLTAERLANGLKRRTIQTPLWLCFYRLEQIQNGFMIIASRAI